MLLYATFVQPGEFDKDEDGRASADIYDPCTCGDRVKIIKGDHKGEVGQIIQDNIEESGYNYRVQLDSGSMTSWLYYLDVSRTLTDNSHYSY